MITDFGKFMVGRGFKLPRHQVQKYLEWSSLRDTLRNLDINCVLDVGANQGQFAKSIRKLGYRGYIVSFEPVKKDFALLTKAFEQDKFWRGFNIALGNENSVRPFNVTVEATTMSSFLAPIEKEWNIKVDQVEIRKLDTLFDELISYIPNPRVFLKIDTQGYDVEVVKGSENCINKILGLLSELSVLPTYENVPNYLEALRIYEQLGFKLISLTEAARIPKTGEIIEYDCLMIRAK